MVNDPEGPRVATSRVAWVWSAPVPVQVGRVLLAGLVVSLLLWVLLDVAAGRSALASGGLFALSTGLVLGSANRLRLPVPAYRDGSFGPRVHVPLAVIRSASWLLFAWESARHELTLPALGDAATALQAVLVVVGTWVISPFRDPSRTARLALDGVVTTSAVVVALWVANLGRAVGHELSGPSVWLGLALCYLVVTEIVTVVLVVVRDRVDRPVPAIATVALIGAAELALIAEGIGGGPRTAGPAVVGLWCAGWVAFVWSASLTRTVPDCRLGPEARARGEARATATAGAVVVLSVVVAVLGAPAGPAGLPGGTWTGVLLLAWVATVSLRGIFLARVRVRLLDDLRTQAVVDPLTGLANRRALSDRIRRLPPDDEWVILALDLDGFKAVNDVHGHGTGDAVLVEVAKALRWLCPAPMLAARTGGDEFAVLLPGDVDRGRMHALEVVRAVPPALGPLRLGPAVTASVGVGRLTPRTADDDADPLGALLEASAALQAAKGAGRNRVQVYPGFVARSRERRLHVETALRRAVQDGSLFTVGQPLVDLVTSRVVAVEALARWRDEVLDEVPPSEFIAVAEASGLVADVGRLVLRSALAGFADNGLIGSGLRLSVNVSPIELRTPGFVDQVNAVLAEFEFPPAHLTIEVTEAVLIAEDDPAVRELAALGDLGAHLAIDDFGTGYSALGYLRRLPVHTLKIDRSLVVDARTSVRTRQIVAGVVDMASRLGLVVVLEGVEDDQAVQLGRQCGAHLGQGYLAGRPMPWAQVAQRWREGVAQRGADEVAAHPRIPAEPRPSPGA